MTAPNNEIPEGSQTEGTLAALQAMTEEDAKEQMSSGMVLSADNFWAMFIAHVLSGFTGGIGDFLDSLVGAVTGNNAGTGGFTDIFDHIGGMQSVGVENATAIAAINAALGSGGSGSGVYFVDTFDRANATTLGSDWSVIDPNGTGIGIENNQAVAGQTTSGSVFARANTPALGDDMSTAIVVGSLLEAAAHEVGLHVRMNTAQTQWVYLNVFKTKVYLGRATRSGSTVTYTDWVSVTSGITVANGTQAEIRATGSTYRAFVGGKQVAAYTDSAVSHPVGSTNRSSGFRVEYDSTPFVGGRSPAIGSFAMADITVPETVGTGWSLYRNNTGSSSSTTWTTTGVAFGSDTFDVEDRKANVEVDNLGIGRIKILKAGWYQVSVSARSSTARALVMVGLFGGTVAGSLSLIRVGSVGQDSDSDASGTPSTSTSPRNWSGSWTVYCPAGYYLAPAGVSQSSSTSVSLIGISGGYPTNFHGALMNPG